MRHENDIRHPNVKRVQYQRLHLKPYKHTAMQQLTDQVCGTYEVISINCTVKYYLIFTVHLEFNNCIKPSLIIKNNEAYTFSC